VNEIKDTIVNWGLMMHLSARYKAPEQATPVVVGEVMLEKAGGMFESEAIQTSRLIHLYKKDGKLLAETKNSLYELKGMSEGFKKYLSDNGHTLDQYIAISQSKKKVEE